MSSPTTRSFDTPDAGRAQPGIADFVSAVRSQLDDLSPDEVTELTGGLEADLTDARAEAGSSPSQLYGDPVEYARELRAAAGLPPRGAGGARRGAGREPGPGLAERLDQRLIIPAREMIEIGLRNLDAKPWWPGVRDFLLVLRPVWWVARAWVFFQIVMSILGVGSFAMRGGAIGGLVLLAMVVVSVQVGRHTPLPKHEHRVLLSILNVIAAVALVPALLSAQVGYDDLSGDPYGDSYVPSGLNLGNEPVTNVFPYDSEGRPLTGVQLYDQDGRPLVTDEGNRGGFDESTGTEFTLVPGSQTGLAPRWNAFPLQQRRTDPNTGELGPVQPATQPLTGVPPLLASPSPTASPGASAEPTSTATASPTESASPSKSAAAPKTTEKAKQK